MRIKWAGGMMSDFMGSASPWSTWASSAAALLGEEGAAVDTSAGGGGAGTGEGAGGGAAPPDPTPPATGGGNDPWYASGVTSDEHKAWLQNKGYASLEDTIAAHRSLEQKLGAGRFNVPSDWTNEEQARAAYKALGLPDQVGDHYKIDLPQGADATFSTGFAEAAHKTGVLPHQAKALAQWYMGQEQSIAEAQATAAREAAQADIAALKGASGWGDKFEANDAVAGAAAKAFNIDGPKMKALAASLGTRGALEFLHDLGRKIGEDGIEGGGARPLGAMGGAAAAEAKATFIGDAEKTAKLRAGDPAATAEWKRINAALAAELDRAEAA